MISRELLREFPTKRVDAEDGMAVTANVWELAHEYHRQRLRFHDLLRHGPGILTGLEVIASDPADSTVYVMPGIAVDSCGEVIALTAPMAYDLGSSHGLLFLLLTYHESRHSLRPGHDDDEIPTIDCQFGIEATVSPPEEAYVELARVRRPDHGGAVTDARDPLHPLPNELDLRYRPQIPFTGHRVVSIAVCPVGADTGTTHDQGVDHLARTLRQSGYRVCVDHAVPLTAALGRGPGAYTLLHLVGRGAFKPSRDEMIALNAYLEAGGTVLFESCPPDASGGEPLADASFLDLLSSLGIKLDELPRGHELLLNPHLFAAPPSGSAGAASGTGGDGSAHVMAAGGVIFSRCDYGCLWQGDRGGGPASRDEIRTAMEWGENLVTFALARRMKAVTT